MARINIFLFLLLLPLTIRSQEEIPEENHETVVIPGMYDGIKQLFGK